VTAILIKVSDFMSKFWWLFIAVFPLLFLAWKPLNKNPQFRRNFETFLLATPVIGPLWEQIMMTTITRTLSLLVSAGVPIVESLQLCSGVTSSRLYEESIIKSARLVEKGFSLAQAFANQTVFPTIVEQMLSVGEETGQVDQLLERISIYFETESEQKVKNLTTAVEPIILIMLGGGVGFLVFAIIMPIYNLTTTL
jgi:type II secretory pathway component PulF